jgi:hypothetical protein
MLINQLNLTHVVQASLDISKGFILWLLNSRDDQGKGANEREDGKQLHGD